MLFLYSQLFSLDVSDTGMGSSLGTMVIFMASEEFLIYNSIRIFPKKNECFVNTRSRNSVVAMKMQVIQYVHLASMLLINLACKPPPKKPQTNKQKKDYIYCRACTNLSFFL